MRKSMSGFTIVELLIVIVVIAILATITTIAFTGIQDRARSSAINTAANQAAKKVQLYQVENSSYPTALSDVGISSANDVTYTYAQGSNWFCVATKSAVNALVVGGSGSSGKCGQLTASYYPNGTLTGNPTLVRTEPNVDYNWGGNSPATGVPADNFSATWTGFLTPPVTDTYTLYFYYDDRFRLYLDNTLAADHWTTGCCVWRTMTYNFTAGQSVPFKIEMAEGAGGAAARIQWSYTGQTQIAIPATAFSI